MGKGLLIVLLSGLIVSVSVAVGLTDSQSPQNVQNTSTNSAVPGLALTEQQELQIRSEEIYRSQVRRQLMAEPDGAKAWTNQVWTDLNSPFVQWLLSSVVISGLVACYTIWQSRREKAKLKRELIEKLDTEISNRIYEALSGTRSYEGSIKNNILWQPNAYYTLIYSFLNNHFDSTQGETYSDFSIFPEFKDCSFRSLITMLYDALKTDKRNVTETAQCKNVLIASESFANLGSILAKESSLSQDNNLRLLMQIREILNANILISRWRKDDLY